MSSECASRLGEFIPRTSGRARWGGSRRDGIMVDRAWRPRTYPPPVPRGGPMSPDDSGSVTLWIGALRGGDLDAAQPLWERYFARLVRLAQARLRTRRGPGAAEDEEDAALSAFDSFCRAATEGRFPRLDDRDDRRRSRR